jgi:hypothetical protein
MEENRERTLRIEIPACNLAGSDGITLDDLSGLNGWLQVPSAAPGTAVYWEGTIDLSGYARDYKTFYPTGGVIQEGAAWLAYGGSGQTVLTYVSSIPLDVDAIVAEFVLGSGPGFMQGSDQQTWTSLLFAESQVNLINANLPALGICQPITVKQSGSLSPTAAQVLYVMKIVAPTTIGGIIGTSLNIPASRIILPGTMDQEPQLEYMMRLARSVELANQV